MQIIKIFSLLLVFFMAITSSVQASNKTEPRPISTVMNEQDPYEDFNRAMFEFNLKFNDSIGIPVSNTYKTIVPQPARTGISNFFDNLTTPISAVNCFLQGKVECGLSEIMRFSINTTFGFFGILDIAEPAGLKAKNEDLGHTLYHWGFWDNSSYLVLPILGPYTTRGLTGRVIDSSYDPTYNYLIKTDDQGRILLFTANGIVQLSKVSDLLPQIKNQPDPYIFSRESYLQLRTNDIYDGKAPQPSLDDFIFD